MAEYEFEPVPGLPERLPPGEAILWQGVPRWQSLARYAFHARKVTLYFLALILLHLTWKVTGGEPVRAALAGAVWLAILAAIAVGLLILLARSISRATLYTITNRRVVMRFGVAIPICINLPFSQITAAAVRTHGDGTGDLPLTMGGPIRASYIVLWPNVRPWHLSPPQPMLRAVPDADTVARTLASALEAARSEPLLASTGIETGEESGSVTVSAVCPTPPMTVPTATDKGSPLSSAVEPVTRASVG